MDPDKGILRNLGPLDREAIDPALGGRIVLSVNVSDSGEPALWTTVSVTITVEVRPGSAGDGVWDEPRIGKLPRRWPVLPPPSSNHISALAIWWVKEFWSQADGLESWLIGCVTLGNQSASLCPQLPHL